MTSTGPAPLGHVRRLVVPSAVFVAAFAVYGLTISTHWVTLDVWSAHFAGWHIATTGSPWVDGLRLPPLDNSPLRAQFVRETVDGHLAITRTPGVIAASVPAYWVFGGSTFSQTPAALTAAAITAAAMVLVLLTLRRLVPARVALLATLVLAFATPVWSVAANDLWPHTVTVLGICGMAWAAGRERWWLFGLFAGVTVWGRLHAAVIAAVVGLLLAWWRHDPRILVRAGLGGAAGLASLCVWNLWVYGTPKPTAAYEAKIFAGYAADLGWRLVPNQLFTWVAPDRGLLVWTPVILLLVPALVRSWRSLPDWTRALVWGGLTYTVLQNFLDGYGGGYGFYGYRLGLEMLICMVPALVLASLRAGRWFRRLVGPVLALQTCAIAVGAIVDDPVLIRPQDGWWDNVFARSVLDGGVVGWVTVIALVGLGAWVGRLIGPGLRDGSERRSGQPEDVGPGPDLDGRGTTISHSVP